MPILSRGARIGLVCAGYGLAIVAGVVAGYAYNARMSAMPYDTSGGMYAAGEFMTALGAFLVVALVPTLLVLWFQRRNGTLWLSIAWASLGFAGLGLLAVLMPLVFRGTPGHPVVEVFGLLGIVQLLGMPLWTVAFVVFALIAPTRPARRLLAAAIGIELVIGVCAAVHWFLPRLPP